MLTDLIIYDFMCCLNIVPTHPILVLYLIPMAQMRHLWSTKLALATMQMLIGLITWHLMSYHPHISNLGSLSHPRGLEEAPVVH